MTTTDTAKPTPCTVTTKLDSPAITAVLDRLHLTAASNDQPVMERAFVVAVERSAATDAEVADVLADAFMCVDPLNGRFLHLLALTRPQGRIVEFGCSMGLSTIYLAAALSADEAPMITTELEPSKFDAARSHVTEAGLADRVEFIAGDALVTLAQLDAPISLLFLDGWKGLYLPMLRLLEPLLVDGALVVADDTLHPALAHLTVDYRSYVNDPANPYVSVSLPVDDGLELSRYCRPS
jgi:predicted O-methyltransferase YrrM